MFRVVKIPPQRPSLPGPLFTPVGRSPIKRVNQYNFYQLGAAVHPLTELRATATFNDVWIPCLTVHNWMQGLLSDQLTPLVTSRSAARHLLEAVEQVTSAVNTSPPASAEQMSSEVGWFELQTIAIAARQFEIIFAAELETTDTYYVSEKGIYSTGRLMEHAERAFSPEIQAELSPQAISDIRQAGKCLAFDLDTACGFHIVRATETMIHRYYVEVTSATPRRKDRNWGAYVRNLNSHRKNNPQTSKVDPKLISLIDQVREHHRNPVMHPEVVLTPDEALSLFNMCQAVIITFAGALKALAGAQLPLKIGFPLGRPVLRMAALFILMS